jgi:thiaminase
MCSYSIKTIAVSAVTVLHVPAIHRVCAHYDAHMLTTAEAGTTAMLVSMYASCVHLCVWLQ